MMENLWKWVDDKLVHANEENKMQRLIENPIFTWSFDNDFTAKHKHRTRWL